MERAAAASALLVWLRASGGLVHPALRVGVSPTTGARGLIAAERIEPTPGRPLVAVPETLVLTSASASAAAVTFHGASPRLGPALAVLDPAAPLAVLLALEAAPDVPTPSPWGLYARSLEGHPPAGWAVRGGDALEAALKAARVPAPDRPSWRVAVAKSRAAAEAAAAAVVRLVEADAGRTPPLEPDAVVAALGHVVSRAFRLPSSSAASSAPVQPALLPVIDLANHAAGSADPAWATAPGAPHRFATLRAASNGGGGRGGPPAGVRLEPGDELTSSYAGGQGGGGALEWFLNYGFVPAELGEKR